MVSDDLTHIIYASTAVSQFGRDELESMLASARINNAGHGVSGMLLYTSGGFFQVLEGRASTLDELYTRIEGDPRHRNVTKIIHEPIENRAFGGWTMAYCADDASGLESIEGLSDFFGAGHSLTELPPGRAKKLLTAFSQGRWRARIAGGPGA